MGIDVLVRRYANKGSRTYSLFPLESSRSVVASINNKEHVPVNAWPVCALVEIDNPRLHLEYELGNVKITLVVGCQERSRLSQARLNITRDIRL